MMMKFGADKYMTEYIFCFILLQNGSEKKDTENGEKEDN